MYYKKPNICEPCGKNCALCKYIIRSDTFFGTDGKEYKVKGYINCETSNLIYSVRCKICCKTMYVGQTGDTFYQRMLLNFSMIRTRKLDNVAEYFYSENHSVNDFMVIGIANVFGEDTYRKVRESFWIKKIENVFPVRT